MASPNLRLPYQILHLYFPDLVQVAFNLCFIVKFNSLANSKIYIFLKLFTFNISFENSQMPMNKDSKRIQFHSIEISKDFI